MANPEHLKILKQEKESWFDWRADHSEIVLDLQGADLSYADLSVSDFCGADLRRANLRCTNLEEALLINARLSFAYLIGADLSHADLTGADLMDADLSISRLSGANLSGANLKGAHLTNADLSRTNLKGVDLTDVALANTTFANNDLSEVKGLETVKHLGPSSIGIDTIYNSQGKIPDAFLRGCGVPEDFIIYMRSLTTQPIQFHTCFISFTEADDTFSERLYNDMQAKGVRCWRWKEDAKWGKTLMRSIDEAVRVYDKLIVICSEQSLNSPAVAREIERALQKEDEQARLGSKEGEVLFPIRLDDYIFTGWNHHRKADVIAKNIGDFRQWKNHDSYSKAFDRLLRDLKA